MNSTECPFLFVLSYLGAKIRISPQTTKDLRENLMIERMSSGQNCVIGTTLIV